MSVENHIAELKKKHQELSEAVEREQRRPGSSDLDIAQMKKEKLRIKEEIDRLS